MDWVFFVGIVLALLTLPLYFSIRSKAPPSSSPDDIECLGTPNLEFEVYLVAKTGHKWISVGSTPNASIPVRPSERVQEWKVERPPDRAVWRFFVEINGERYYISYSNTTDNITLRASNNTKRSFEVLVQPGGGLLMRDPDDATRVLVIKDGVLAMGDGDDPLYQWLVLESDMAMGRLIPELIQDTELLYRVDVLMDARSRKWINDQVDPHDNIPVNQDGEEQNWTLHSWPNSWKFSAEKYELYASAGFETKYLELLTDLEGKWASATYEPVTAPKLGAVLLQNEQNHEFVSWYPEHKFLLFETNRAPAVSWDVDVTGIMHTVGEKYFLFPALCFLR